MLSCNASSHAAFAAMLSCNAAFIFSCRFCCGALHVKRLVVFTCCCQMVPRCSRLLVFLLRSPPLGGERALESRFVRVFCASHWRRASSANFSCASCAVAHLFAFPAPHRLHLRACLFKKDPSDPRTKGVKLHHSTSPCRPGSKHTHRKGFCMRGVKLSHQMYCFVTSHSSVAWFISKVDVLIRC